MTKFLLVIGISPFNLNQNADLAMSGITLTPMRDTVVDFSYPYYITGMTFFTKKPSPLPKIFAIFWPYEINVWISVVVTLPTFALLYWIITKISNTGFRRSMTFGRAASQIGQILVNQGEKKTYFLKSFWH